MVSTERKVKDKYKPCAARACRGY